MKTIEEKAIAIIRAELESHACRCFVCKGPATREFGHYGICIDSNLFCDDHDATPEDVAQFIEDHADCKCGGKPYKDLLRADLTRHALALFDEVDDAARDKHE